MRGTAPSQKLGKFEHHNAALELFFTLHPDVCSQSKIRFFLSLVPHYLSRWRCRCEVGTF